jgi:glutathione S-transferase
MEEMLKVWGRRNSINVQKAMWTVGELALPYERVDVGGPFGGLDTSEFRAMNPHGLIPVVQDGDVTIWESNAVIRYLAATYGKRELWPESSAKRALADAWMDWMLTTVYPDFIRVFWGLVRTPPSKRNHEAIGRAVSRLGESFLTFDACLEGRSHIIGDGLTVGDIPVGATLYRYFALDIDRPKLPTVERMYAGLMERPAYREHVAVSFDDLLVSEG